MSEDKPQEEFGCMTSSIRNGQPLVLQFLEREKKKLWKKKKSEMEYERTFLALATTSCSGASSSTNPIL